MLIFNWPEVVSKENQGEGDSDVDLVLLPELRCVLFGGTMCAASPAPSEPQHRLQQRVSSAALQRRLHAAAMPGTTAGAAFRALCRWRSARALP